MEVEGRRGFLRRRAQAVDDIDDRSRRGAPDRAGSRRESSGGNRQADADGRPYQGSVGDRLRALYKDPKYQYPNTDEGKVQLIADLNLKVQAVTAKLPAWFGALPKAKLEIHRVPKAIEAGAPGGYYNPPPLDNSRPGIYWINLRDTAEVPRNGPCRP